MSAQAGSEVRIPDDLVLVGYVSGAYGLNGWIRVRPYSSDADALLHARTWWLGSADSGTGAGMAGQLRDIDMLQSKLHSGDVVAQLMGIAGRDAAEALKGAAVQISRSYFPALSDDEFYWVDLIGLEVGNLQGERLGLVRDMMDNGAHPILMVGPGKPVQDYLIPFVGQYIKTVDRSSGKITVDWGLDY